MVAGAAPPAAIIEGMRNIGINVTHVYGLTETYGPSALCASQAGWSDLSIQEQAQLHSAIGLPYPTTRRYESALILKRCYLFRMMVKTMGEIMFRGNIVMKGYLKTLKQRLKPLPVAWFHTGDLAVCQPDGYAKITDRSKDVIISVEKIFLLLKWRKFCTRHPAVLTAAVVAKPDSALARVLVPLLNSNEAKEATPEELIEFCNDI